MVKKLYLLIISLIFIILIGFVIALANTAGLVRNSQWQENLTAIRYGSLSLGDIDNDGDLDLALSGCLSDGGNRCEAGTILKIYINNGTTLTENSTWNQNLTGIGWSSTALGDIDNDGDLDLASSGCTNAGDNGASCNGNVITRVYINNGTTLIESSQWQNNLTGSFDGHISLNDIDNNGYLDLLQIGRDATDNKVSKVYINNGTTLIESSQWQNNLTGLDDSSLALGDIDNNGYLDLALTGEDSSSTKKTKMYLNNGSTLTESSQWQNSLLQLSESSSIFGDIDNDGDLDYIIMGCCDYLYSYENNGSSLIVKQRDVVRGDSDLIGIFAGSLAFGDYDNDGYLDFAGIGREPEGYNTIYWNNITKKNNFSVDNIASQDIKSDGFYLGPIVFGDIDNDNDLDAISTGLNISMGLLARVYISNTSLTKKNTQPTPPNIFSSSYSDGILNLIWNNGSDTETNSTGLYYNLMVGNSTTNNTIVSGIYGGSSGGGDGGGPSAGYFGNMMQRKNISLNKYLSAGTYYWYVQAIDTGLAKSNWSERQSIVIGADTDVPTLSDISSSVTSSTAIITWTTNESSNSSVYYGTTASTTSFSGSSGLTTSHSITLSSLSASILYYYNVSSCDYWGNCNTSIQYTFTTSATPASPGGGNGGGGGGGRTSGGGAVIITPTPEVKEFDIDFSTEITGTLETEQGDVKTFSFQGEVTHKITATEITTNSIKLIIESDPIILILDINETKQIDINSDGIDDIEIKLISITNRKAKFTITKLEGADIVAREELRKEALFDVKVDVENFFKVVKSGRDVLAKIEVFNINNIGQVDVKVDYYIIDKKNNTIAEGSDTLAVEAVASFVRSLTVPYDTKSGVYYFNVDVSYKDVIMASGHAEFRVIRNYEIIIGVGVIILIIIGIFVYLWRIKRKEEKDVGMLKRQISKLKNRGKRGKSKKIKWQK